MSVIDTTRDRVIDSFRVPPTLLGFGVSRDASYVAIVKKDGTILIRNTSRRATTPSGKTLPGGFSFWMDVAISPEGTTLALGRGGYVEVRTLDGSPVRWRIDAPGVIHQLQFNDTGSQILVVSVGEDDSFTISVADVSAKRIIYTTRRSNVSPQSVRFGSAPSTLLLRRADIKRERQAMQEINIDPIRMAATICRTIGRPMDPEEWSLLVRDAYVDTCRELTAGSRRTTAAASKTD